MLICAVCSTRQLVEAGKHRPVPATNWPRLPCAQVYSKQADMWPCMAKLTSERDAALRAAVLAALEVLYAFEGEGEHDICSPVPVLQDTPPVTCLNDSAVAAVTVHPHLKRLGCT